MDVTLNIDGKEIKAMISAEEWKKLQCRPKHTGYERVSCRAQYYYSLKDGTLGSWSEKHDERDNAVYSVANYYSDETVAKNNARADMLMRKLRRFAAEHGGCIAPKDIFGCCYCVLWDRINHVLFTLAKNNMSAFSICFHTQEAAELAIKEFKDELIWYFTEYSPMPEGYWDE